MNVKIKRLTETAKMPYHGTTESACWDLYADRVEIKDDRIVYYTGIAIELPKRYCALVFPRSSVVKTGLFMGNSVGVIDQDYIGEIRCVFYRNNNAKLYEIGDRIAQIMIQPVIDIEWEETESLSETERGTGGYGSTGR